MNCDWDLACTVVSEKAVTWHKQLMVSIIMVTHGIWSYNTCFFFGLVMVVLTICAIS